MSRNKLALFGAITAISGGLVIGCQSVAGTRAQQGMSVDAVRRSFTADLNVDGFVTTDELIAMELAGLSDDAMLTRLLATNQVFDLSGSQKRAMGQAGVSQRVLRNLPDINHFERERALGSRF